MSEVAVYHREVIGFRAWRVPLRSPTLYSTSRRRPWKPGTVQAICAKGRKHRPPDPDCACGIYALHELNEACLLGSRSLVGAIATWGDIEVYEDGIRAEYARIMALARPPRTTVSEQTARAVAQHYGVPLTSPEELAGLRTARDRVPLPDLPHIALMLIVDRSRAIRRYGTLSHYRAAISEFVSGSRTLSLGIITVGHHAALSRAPDTGAYRSSSHRSLSWLQLEGERTPLDEALALARRELLVYKGKLHRMIVVVSASRPSQPERVIREASRCTQEGIEIAAVGTADADIGLLRGIASDDPVITSVAELSVTLPGIVERVASCRGAGKQ